MRSVQMADLLAAARVMVSVAKDDRPALRDRMLKEAEIADRYTRRTGKAHPIWGNGTLKDAARRHERAGVASLDDPVCCEVLILLLEGLRRRPRAVSL